MRPALLPVDAGTHGQHLSVERIDVTHLTRALPVVALQIRPARPDLLTYATWP